MDESSKAQKGKKMHSKSYQDVDEVRQKLDFIAHYMYFSFTTTIILFIHDNVGVVYISFLSISFAKHSLH